VAGRRHYGVFEGNVFFSSSKADTPEVNPCNFVPKGARSIYTPGLTYLEMLTYAAKLRMNLSLPEEELNRVVLERVMIIFDIMDITYCKDRVVPNRPTSRGVLGGELRKLSIATEIINFTPVIILDDCTLDLEAIAAAQVVQCLVKMAKKGHTVISSLPRPSIQVFNQFDKVVLVSGGITLFASARDNITRFFCNRPLDYQLSEDVDISDFLLDIADGLERPVGARRALSNEEIALQFQQSAYHEPFSRSRTAKTPMVKAPSSASLVDVLPQTHREYFGYFNTAKPLDNFALTGIVLRRAFFVKFRETAILMKSMKGMCFMGLFLGYFSLGVGSYGDYVSSLLGMPYPETTNLGAVLFICLAINYGCQVINVHIIGQKIKTFRYEQRAGACPTLGFWLTCIVSEIPFTIFFAMVFSNLLYFMGDLNQGLEDYLYFMVVQALVAVIGILTAVMFTAVFRREIVVRDLFVFCLFLMIMTSGMLFTQQTMRTFVVDISKINCLRWSYEAIMVWKFKDYPDGWKFLTNYSFQNFEKNKIFHILINFIIFDCAVILLALLPPPNTLRRRKQDEVSIKDRATKFEKRDSEVEEDRFSNRLTDTGGGSLFARELTGSQSSTQGKNTMSQASAHGLEGDEEEIRGPVVSLVGLTYRWVDRKADVGYHEALSNISCSFPYGQLNGILGAEGSGKSSLLHIIAGQFKPSTVQGSVLFNGKSLDFSSQAPWQVCGFIEAVDNLFRDLSVKEVLTYAMKLRCADKQSSKLVDLNVQKTLDLLKLTAHAGIKIKKLHAGRQRCVSIAEEIVHGPNVVLIDEPITGLGLKYTKIIMNHALRELANQRRTVISTIHQPTSSIFQLYDNVAVLSKGRLVYMGPGDEALSFFIESPNLKFSYEGYSNAAEFLHDISGSLIVNSKGEQINSLSLENNFTTSKQYVYQSNYTNFVEYAEVLMDSTANPMVKGMGAFDTSVEDEKEKERTSSVKRTSSANKRSLDNVNNNKFSNVSAPSFVKSICSMDIVEELKKMYILLERSFFVLFRRGKLVVGSTVVIALIALTFGFIVGKSSNESGTVTATFIMGTLLLIMSNLQLVFFLLKNNEVFLREHSRGLYSIAPYWLINDLPLMLMRGVQSFLYAFIIHEILQLNTDSSASNFFYLSIFVIVLSGTQMVSSVAYLLKDVRDAYSAIPGLSFLLFMFSGLVFKAQTLPAWMAPWLPSVSIIRWAAQGLMINEYEYNREAFPDLGPTQGYSTWQSFVSLFGWGGKTKWYCFNVVILNFIIFRVMSLLASISAAYSQRGKRALIKPVFEERLY
jgi:ABC-type multidrug transport system ATPase subunit